MEQANAETDVQKRAKILQQAEAMLIQDQLPVIPLYIYAGINYYHTNISGIHQNVIDMHPLNYIRKTGK
jgi:oligopeptide transport system substrate-binding protein